MNARQGTRYYLIRGVTYVAEAGLFALFVWVGMTLAFAFVCCRLCSYTLDFFVQRRWTFRDSARGVRAVAREGALYLLIRGGALVGGFCLWWYLHHVEGVPEIAAFLIAIAIFWTIAFFFYQLIFVGPASDLYPLIQKLHRRVFSPRSQ